MEKITNLRAAVADLNRHQNNDVVMLRCPDQLHFDTAPIQHLFNQKSQHDAEDIICRMLEDIALRLDLMQTDLAGSNFSKLLKPANRIKIVADQLGLIEVSMSAVHVATCLNQRDGVALEATMARLERSFDIAVSEVWNFPEH